MDQNTSKLIYSFDVQDISFEYISLLLLPLGVIKEHFHRHEDKNGPVEESLCWFSILN